MYKFLSRNGTAVAFGLGLFVSLIGLIAILSGLNGYSSLPEEERGTTSIFNAGLWGAILLSIAAVVLTIGFGLLQTFSEPKKGIRFVLGLVGILLIGFLFYQFSEVETSGKIYNWIQGGMLTGGVSKVLNGALWLMIILALVALLCVFVGEIRNMFK